MQNDLTYVNFGGMETGAANFGRVAKALETELNDLNAKVQKHFADWEGGAKQAYNDAQVMWRSTADSMNNLVVQLQNVITTGHENYSNAESTNTKIWG